ncbi:MAG: UDP-N-acetylglucosamine diphosphorylase [Oscillospiraceae bacterium]|nr:UDP-N-acetylglucosamine diphosphorylase [Oscillospiraceae bacterium]
MSVIENEKKYLEIILKHESNGVEFLTSHGIVIEEGVKIGRGTQILPGTILKGNTVIGENCVIGPNSMLTDCTIGDGVVFNASQGAESVVEDGAKIGPFTQLRPNSHICKKVKIGDFVEVKNSTVGEGTSIAHLTYIGDSDVGRHVNFGCGVVTVNYDGASKNRCTIGDYAFIGCNTNLIAPVKVGNGAYTAAGSTITKDVPDGDLAVARARQENKSHWAEKKLSGYIEKHSK